MVVRSSKTQAGPTAVNETTSGLIRRRWPAFAALAFAVVVLLDPTADGEFAPVLAAAAVVYLGAAAVGKRTAAWPMFFVTAVIITLVRLVSDRLDPTWVLLGFGAVLAIYGLVSGAVRPAHGLPLQSIALFAFGAAASAAALVDSDLSSYVVAAGLLAHAAWDVHHHRTKRVVTQSLAEFCAVLDIVLAVAVILATALR